MITVGAGCAMGGADGGVGDGTGRGAEIDEGLVAVLAAVVVATWAVCPRSLRIFSKNACCAVRASSMVRPASLPPRLMQKSTE
jgi:hypothetical protein